MIAERRADRHTDLARRKLIHNPLEIGNRIPRIQPAEIAAFGGRTVLRKEPSQLLEFCTVLQPLMEIVETAFGLDIGNQLIDLDQDMTGMGLLHLRRHGRAAFGQQLDDVKTIGTAQNGRQLPGRQFHNRFGKDSRHAIKRTGAQTAAAQAIRRIRVGGSHLGKILAGL